MLKLDRNRRAGILSAVQHTVQTKFYDPKLKGIDWAGEVEKKRDLIVSSADPGEFIKNMNNLLKSLRASHMGFFHESVRRATAKMALSATLFEYRNGGEPCWIFQDVHEGGPADLAGIRAGDALLRVDGTESHPPDAPMFPMGDRLRLLVRKASGGEQIIEITVPDPKSKKHPVIIPKLILTQKLEGGIGYLKVSMFPGVVGIEIARDITRAVEELACDRLIIDLRGNSGGGMGCLRLMSLMVPDRRPVGYSVTRKKAESGFDRERLPRFDEIPERKLGLVPLLAKFAFGDKSIAVFTEGRGPNRLQGRIVLLVNEHSASASEMVAAFAATEGRLQIVGTRTPGRVVGANSFKVGGGFRVALPVAAYRTWDGTVLEGIGVAPTINVDFAPQATSDGQDPQLEAARAMTAEW